MKVVALISGGKDSCYNLMQCAAFGHELVALANLRPEKIDEIDSWMFQTVGHDVIDAYSTCLGVPLIRHTIKGSSLATGKDYTPTAGDEVEDLLQLLQTSMQQVPGIQAVSCGAILSDYQRMRVEGVCKRLGLVSLSYLWQRQQEPLLREMCDAGLHAILIKVAALGLTPRHLGKSLQQLEAHLISLNAQFGVHPCGEGGEYESLVLDCPLFSHRLVIDESETVMHSDDGIVQVAYLRIPKYHLEAKENDQTSLQEVLSRIRGSSQQLVAENTSAPVSLVPLQAAEENPWSHVVVESENVASAFASLKEGLTDVQSVLSVSVFCPSLIAEFGNINTGFASVFSDNPPSRAAVGGVSGSKCVISAVTCKLPKSVMHVQSISRWAPACIGPYAQFNTAAGLAFVAGQIGLDPPTMSLVSSPMEQALLCTQHVDAILTARDVSHDRIVLSTVFLSAQCGRAEQTSALEHILTWSPRAASSIVVVPELPRNAAVEVSCIVATEGSYCVLKRDTVRCADGSVLLVETASSDLHRSFVIQILSPGIPIAEIARILGESRRNPSTFVVMARIFSTQRLSPNEQSALESIWNSSVSVAQCLVSSTYTGARFILEVVEQDMFPSDDSSQDSL